MDMYSTNINESWPQALGDARVAVSSSRWANGTLYQSNGGIRGSGDVLQLVSEERTVESSIWQRYDEGDIAADGLTRLFPDGTTINSAGITIPRRPVLHRVFAINPRSFVIVGGAAPAHADKKTATVASREIDYDVFRAMGHEERKAVSDIVGGIATAAAAYLAYKQAVARSED